MKIVERLFYNGAKEKIIRLGIGMFDEVIAMLERTPLRETTSAIDELRSQHLPLVVLAIEHDGPGPALPKKRKKT
jgi:hypothetical protein